MKPVKTDLELLIRHLEAESRQLKRMIKEAAAEHDNLIAYYHSEALLELNRRLNILYNFRDPYYDQKNELIRQIEYIKKMSFSEFSDRIRGFMKEKYAGRVTEFENKLLKLNEEPAKTYFDTKIIDNALTALYNKQHKWLKLFVNYEEKFGLRFSIKKNELIITLLGSFDYEEPDFVMDSRVPRKLEGLGFQLDNKQNKYVKTFTFRTIDDIPAIKQWITRFVIDFCWMWGSASKVQLVYG